MKRAVFVLSCILPVLACSKPRIDASNDQKLKDSIQSVRNSLPEDRRQKFDAALALMLFKDLGAESKMKTAVDGKTGDDVIAAADRVKQELEAKEREEALLQKAKEREQALSEIKELEEKRASAERSREALKAFEVKRSRFYKRDQGFGTKQSVIEMTVRNGTLQPIAKAFFHGRLSSPGRAVPWFEDDFSYEISGGLEPGEEASWHLAPNMFSGWGTASPGRDAVLTVDIRRLDGQSGKTLYSVETFSEKDGKRLEELKSKFAIK